MPAHTFIQNRLWAARMFVACGLYSDSTWRMWLYSIHAALFASSVNKAVDGKRRSLRRSLWQSLKANRRTKCLLIVTALTGSNTGKCCSHAGSARVWYQKSQHDWRQPADWHREYYVTASTQSPRWLSYCYLTLLCVLDKGSPFRYLLVLACKAGLAGSLPRNLRSGVQSL